MAFTKAAVELFISAKAAAVTACGASDMTAAVPESQHWLSHFGLSAIFHDFPPAEMRPFVITFIRRIHAAFLEYELARQNVLELVKDGNGRWSSYFAALTHFEMVLSQLYVAVDLVRKRSKHDFFKTGDGSFEEHLNLIYNASKHDLPDGELPIWFTNTGISCAKANVTFVEVEDFLSKMAGVVKGLCDRETALKVLQQ